MIRTANDHIPERYGTFLVAPEASLPHFETAPFGLEVDWVRDPMRRESSPFLELLQTLDGLTFGPEGMPMDKWVFYDCAELPGFIYGFATRAGDLTDREHELFGTPPGYEGPVPLSMYIAIPMYEPGCWFGHNLASLNSILPERRLKSLGRITKALALRVCRAEHLYGATQWTSRALHIHTRFGPLQLDTTYTPVHTVAETLTYRFPVTDACLRAAAGDPELELERPSPDFHLDAADTDAMKRMQGELEAGAGYELVDRPEHDGDRVTHPIRRTG